MKKIVIDENYNITYKGDIKEDLEKKILEEVTKYYSKDKLEFKRNEKYKKFVIKIDGKKYKIVVSKTREDLENNIEDIVSDICTNTALFTTYNKESEESFCEGQTSIYKDIINSKETVSETSKRCFSAFIINIIFNLFLAVIMCMYTPTLAPMFASYAGSMIGISAAVKDSLGKNLDTGFGKFSKLWLCGIPGIIESIVHKIFKIGKNIVGDIKNEKFSLKKFYEEHIKKIFVKNKTPKSLTEVEDELKEIAQSLDDDTINPSIYMLNVTKNANTPKEKISIHDFSKYLRDLIGKLSPLDSQRFASKLDDILDKYTTKEIVQSDLVHNEVVSQLMTLNDEIDCFLLLNQNNTDTIDELLETTKPQQLAR